MTAKESSPIIKFVNVSKTYRLYKDDRSRLLHTLFGYGSDMLHKKNANKKLSFEINRGDSVAVIGKNGAGKSTMLKIITGVTTQTSGEVHVEGKVGALLELTAGFDRELTGRENIYLRGLVLGFSRSQVQKIEKKIVSFADIGEYIDQPVRTYSSGMKARLGFAINANIVPDILVIDEALSVGDAEFREKCRARIKHLLEKEHVTVLLVTHSMESAREFCDKGIVINKGKLVFYGEINKAIEAYENL